jgi:hypothetical protein
MPCKNIVAPAKLTLKHNTYRLLNNNQPANITPELVRRLIHLASSSSPSVPLHTTPTTTISNSNNDPEEITVMVIRKIPHTQRQQVYVARPTVTSIYAPFAFQITPPLVNASANVNTSKNP